MPWFGFGTIEREEESAELSTGESAEVPLVGVELNGVEVELAQLEPESDDNPESVGAGSFKIHALGRIESLDGW